MHRTNHGHVMDALGMRVLLGQVGPGQALPNENQLMVELGVGRGAVREATKALQAKGLVVSRPRTGARVQARTQWNFLDADVLRWLGSARPDQLADELSDLRDAVEPHAARLAAERAEEADMAAIIAAYGQMVAAADSEGPDAQAAFKVADLAFHRAVLAATHNELLISLGHALEMALSGNFEKGMQVPGAVAASVPRHALLLHAIRVGDGQAAAAAAHGLVEKSAHDIAAAGPWTVADDGPDVVERRDRPR